VQSARLRLDRPGMQAVQQRKPAVVFMRYHVGRLGRGGRQVNRATSGCCATDTPVAQMRSVQRLCAETRDRLARGWIESAGAKGHVGAMTLFSLHNRALRFAGNLLNRR